MKVIEKAINNEKQKERELKRMLKIQTILIIIVALIFLIVSFKAMKISIEYEALKQEKENLEILVEAQQERIKLEN